MAKKQKAKQEVANKTVVIFKGYDDEEEGTFQKGDRLEVTGYDAGGVDEDGEELEPVYNVTRIKDGEMDSIYREEFEPTDEKATPASKQAEQEKATKKASAKKAKEEAATKEEEEEKEEEDELLVAAALADSGKRGSKKATTEVKKALPADLDLGEYETLTEAVKDFRSGEYFCIEEEEEESEETAPDATEETTEENEEEEEEELPKFKKTTGVSKVLRDCGGDAIKAAVMTADAAEHAIFVHGGVLAFVKRNESFRDILVKDEETGEDVPLYSKGLAGFNDYVKAELGMQPRRATYYVDLYEMWSQLTTEAKIAKVGWTKLRETLPLAGKLSEEEAEELVEEMKKMSTRELHDKVTKILVDKGETVHGNRSTENKAQLVKFTFAVMEDQSEEVLQGLAKAKEVIGDDASDSQALVHIVREWSQFADGTE